MNRINILENAWKENKATANENDPEEIIEDAITMSLSNIKEIIEMATDLMSNLNQNNAQCLSKSWIVNKLVLAEDYMSAVHDHIKYYAEYPDSETEQQEEQQDNAFFGNFDGHDGHSSQADKFGGKKRSELKDSDFLFPEDRSFPIVIPKDVKDAVRNFGRTNKNISYDAFIKKLYNKAKNKGPEFVAAIPKATKDKLGIKKDKADYEKGNF